MSQCEEGGPASLINIFTDIPGFLLAAILPWIALIYLNFSTEKGNPHIDLS
jgi:hypothetical protein